MSNPSTFKKLSKYYHWISLLLIFTLAFLLRFHRLDEIPGEMWGDIVDNYKNIKFIFAGAWPFYFALGIGPLYLYLAAPFLKLIGMSFFTMKVMSNLVGIVAIGFTYLFAKEVFGKRVALFAAFFFAVSKWALIFSRFGNANILVALFTGWIFYLLAKYLHHTKMYLLIMIAAVSALGMYIYPGYWLFPPFVGLVFLLVVLRAKLSNTKKVLNLILFVVVFLIVMVPFFVKLVPQMGLGSGGSYIGSKLFIKNGQVNPELYSQLWKNTKNSFLMFHVKGDTIFRTNVSGQKQIDTISGYLLFLGVLSLLFRWKFWPKILLFLPFVATQIPSILVVNFPNEIPSATRTVGILPFLYTFLALGLDEIWKMFAKIKILRFLIVLLIMLSVATLNFYHYFTLYRLGLPDKNIPFAKTIANHLVQKNNISNVYMNGCCWGSSAQPEPGAVNFLMGEKFPFSEISLNSQTVDMLCEGYSKNERNVLVLSPKDEAYEQTLRRCIPTISAEVLENSNLKIAKLLYLYTP